MHEEVLEQKTKRVFRKIKDIKILSEFYLAGGTGLALQFGHRKSIDLDWFSPNFFSLKKLKNELSSSGKLKIDGEDEDTLNCALDGVKLSFFKYPYRVLFPFIRYKNIILADFKDIACMKIDAISSRGGKKDFIDLYFILEKISLGELLNLFDEKYKNIKYNRLHILKSLSYFGEAEKEPLPVMLKEISWDIVKKNIIRETKKLI